MYVPNSNGIIGDVSRAASPELAYQIGQAFKRKDQEGSAQHLLAHAVLGAAVSYATGNNITTGALSGVGSEVAAPVLANYLYGTKDPEILTQDEKDTITSILTLATITTSTTTSDSNINIEQMVNNISVGRNAVEWNNSTQQIFFPDITEEIERHQKTGRKPTGANVEGEIGYMVALGVAAKASSGIAKDTAGKTCRTDTLCLGAGPIVEISTQTSLHGNSGVLTNNSIGWSITATGGTTIGVGGGLSGSIGRDGSASGGAEGKIGFGAGGAVLVCRKEVGECH